MNKDMKKKYIQPTVQVVKIPQSQMLCASPGGKATGVSNSDYIGWQDGGFDGDDDDV